MSLPLLSTLPTPSQNRSNGGKDQVNSLPHTDSITKGATVWKIGFKKRYLTRSVAQREGTDSQELKLLPPSPIVLSLHLLTPFLPLSAPSIFPIPPTHGISLAHPFQMLSYFCLMSIHLSLFVSCPTEREINDECRMSGRESERKKERGGGRKGERGSRGDNEESQKMFSCVLKEIGTSCLRF